MFFCTVIIRCTGTLITLYVLLGWSDKDEDMSEAVAHVGQKRIVFRGLVGKPEGKSTQKKQALVGMIILNCILKK
jgi:hypothetical protein